MKSEVEASGSGGNPNGAAIPDRFLIPATKHKCSYCHKRRAKAICLRAVELGLIKEKWVCTACWPKLPCRYGDLDK